MSCRSVQIGCEMEKIHIFEVGRKETSGKITKSHHLQTCKHLLAKHCAKSPSPCSNQIHSPTGYPSPTQFHSTLHTHHPQPIYSQPNREPLTPTRFFSPQPDIPLSPIRNKNLPPICSAILTNYQLTIPVSIISTVAFIYSTPISISSHCRC